MYAMLQQRTYDKQLDINYIHMHTHYSSCPAKNSNTSKTTQTSLALDTPRLGRLKLLHCTAVAETFLSEGFAIYSGSNQRDKKMVYRGRNILGCVRDNILIEVLLQPVAIREVKIKGK